MADKLAKNDQSIENMSTNENTEKHTRAMSRMINEYDIIDDSEELNVTNSDNSKSQNKEVDISQIQRKGIRNNSRTVSVTGNQVENKQSRVEQGLKLHISERELEYKDSDSTNSLEDQLETSCPRVNCPERIIICLDLDEEMDKVTFRSRAGDKWTPLKLVKRALRLFLHSKNRISKQHLYSLVILQDQALWVRDFTNNPRDIINVIEDIEETFHCETFDLSSLFDVINSNIEIPQVEGDASVLPPPYTVRVLLVFGRSQCPVEFNRKETFRLLESSPYFFVDALYVHEPPSEDNLCETIFDTICDLDEKGLSYIFEAARNPTKLYDQMAQLLAHPLQRPLQQDVSYRLLNMADIETFLPM